MSMGGEWHEAPFYEIDVPPSMNDQRCAVGDHSPICIRTIGLFHPIKVWVCSWCGESLYAIPRSETVQVTGGVL